MQCVASTICMETVLKSAKVLVAKTIGLNPFVARIACFGKTTTVVIRTKSADGGMEKHLTLMTIAVSGKVSVKTMT